jgi:Predicted transcriptional regulator
MTKLLPKKTVREMVGVSFAQIDRWEKDPHYAHLGFPKRRRIGSRVFWLSDEIETFIERQR